MTALSVGALSGKTLPWDGIDWTRCQREVRRLQTRIVKATQEGRWGKVKALLAMAADPLVFRQSTGRQTGD